MVDPASIQAAAGSLKAAADITVGLLKLSLGTEAQAKIVELNREIIAAQSSAMAAQSDQFTLIERIRELEKQIAQFETWNAEKQRYELKQVQSGAFAYVPKIDMEQETAGTKSLPPVSAEPIFV